MDVKQRCQRSRPTFQPAASEGEVTEATQGKHCYNHLTWTPWWSGPVEACWLSVTAVFLFEGASAAGAGGQGAGGEDQLHRQQGQTPGLQSLRLTEDPPGDRHLPHSVSPLYTFCRERIRTVNTVYCHASSMAQEVAMPRGRPPLCSKQKQLLDRHSWSMGDEPYQLWWFPDFSCSAPKSFTFTLNYINITDVRRHSWFPEDDS